MSASPEMKDVAGIFNSEETAAAAVKTLIEEHFSQPDALSVSVANGPEREAVPIVERFPVERVAAIGAALGALLAGGGVAIAGLTFGPFTLIAWGPLWAAFEAAYTGGSLGFALGALWSIEMAEPAADFSRARVRGDVCVGVHVGATRAGRASEILAEAGAKLVTVHESAMGPFHFPHAA